MALDENKTALTHRVTAIAAGYLDGAGFKPIETEVPVAAGWIADLASFVDPTRTEARKLKLVSAKRGQIGEQEYQELMWHCGPYLTALVEVKVTPGDFRKDIDRKFNCPHPPAHLLYLAYPRGMIEPDQIPAGWLGLETSKEGTRLLKRHNAPYNNHRPFDLRSPPYAQSPGDVAEFIAEVAIRRDHRTRFVAVKAAWAAFRAEERPHKRSMAVSRIAEILAGWMQHEGVWKDSPLVEAMERNGVEVPYYLRESLVRLADVREKLDQLPGKETE